MLFEIYVRIVMIIGYMLFLVFIWWKLKKEKIQDMLAPKDGGEREIEEIVGEIGGKPISLYFYSRKWRWVEYMEIEVAGVDMTSVKGPHLDVALSWAKDYAKKKTEAAKLAKIS